MVWGRQVLWLLLCPLLSWMRQLSKHWRNPSDQTELLHTWSEPRRGLWVNASDRGWPGWAPVVAPAALRVRRGPGAALRGCAQGGVRHPKSQPGGKFGIRSCLSCALTSPHEDGSRSCRETAKKNFNRPFHLDRDLRAFSLIEGDMPNFNCNQRLDVLQRILSDKAGCFTGLLSKQSAFSSGLQLT